MGLLRLIGNAIRLSIYVPYVCLYWSVRIFGSVLAIIPWAVLTIYLISRYHNDVLLYVGVFGWAFFRFGYKHMKPPPPLTLYRAPAPPPPPPPSASAAKGRADDPNEATVIGRLDPKLRELLRQKPDASASRPTASKPTAS